MSYISERKSRLDNRLKQVQTALDALYATRLQQSASQVESYSLETGEGGQRATRRSIEKTQKQIEILEAEEDHIVNELSGMGLINIAVRRKSLII